MADDEFDEFDLQFAYSFGLLSDEVFRISKAHGWFEDKEPNLGEKIALIHSELSEALEALRKGGGPSEHIPQFSHFEEELAIDLLYRRMADKAEQHRVFLAFVEPAYSSQTCNSCRAIDKKSRNGEVFKCTVCGHADDADHNASMNILQRFLDGHFTVARGTQRA